MYPIRLNLMSQKKQQYAKRIMTMGFIKNTLAVIFIMLSCFAIFSIISQLFLQTQFADIALQSLRTHTSVGEIDARIQKINTITKQASAIQDQYREWSSPIVLIAQTIPAENTIAHIGFVGKDNRLELAGSSPSREAFLTLKDKLESLDQIDKVTIPLSDLTKQDKINFTLSIPFTF